MTTTLAPLKWVTTINGVKKVATTHFGTRYTLEKSETLGGWGASVTVPPTKGFPVSGGTEVLVRGTNFAAARAVALADYAKSGGR